MDRRKTWSRGWAVRLSLLLIALGFCLLSPPSIIAQNPQDENLSALLKDLRTPILNVDKLAILFQTGDSHIPELIQALSSGDRETALAAQLVIRYLGNADGMAGLEKELSRKKVWETTGPVPAPLSNAEFEVLERLVFANEPRTWGFPETSYVWALVLDGSERARLLLAWLDRTAASLEPDTYMRQALQLAKERLSSGQSIGSDDPLTYVRKNLFFIPQEERQGEVGSLIATSSDKRKALVEVVTSSGEVYHVVVCRAGEGWKFLSISLVSVS